MGAYNLAKFSKELRIIVVGLALPPDLCYNPNMV